MEQKGTRFGLVFWKCSEIDARIVNGALDKQLMTVTSSTFGARQHFRSWT
jgi:hypothetical protein